MKHIKKLILLVLALILTAITIPQIAYADDEVNFTVSASPMAVGELGGDITITININNTGTETFQLSTIYIETVSDEYENDIDAEIPAGDSASYTYDITLNDIDLNEPVYVFVFGVYSGSGFNERKEVTVSGEENIIRSDSVIEPEQTVYYVGDTVSIMDTMRNSLSASVTSLKMEYYLRDETDTRSGDTVTIGTVSGGDTAENTLEYTFTQDDIGELRIGSKLTYYVAGAGPYTEYNVAHDFVIKASPTPTLSPTPTQTPTEEITAPPEAEDMGNTHSEDAQKTSLSASQQTDNAESEEKEESSESVFGDSDVMLVLIILGGVIVVMILILLIVMAAKKK